MRWMVLCHVAAYCISVDRHNLNHFRVCSFLLQDNNQIIHWLQVRSRNVVLRLSRLAKRREERHPMSADVLSIDKNRTLAHTSHPDSNWVISFRSIKVSLVPCQRRSPLFPHSCPFHLLGSLSCVHFSRLSGQANLMPPTIR